MPHRVPWQQFVKFLHGPFFPFEDDKFIATPHNPTEIIYDPTEAHKQQTEELNRTVQ